MKFSKIHKNTIVLFANQVYSKITAVIFFTLAARILTVSDFGKYTLVLVFISFFYIISDWGLSPLVMRDVAKEPEKAKEYLFHTIILRISLSLISYLVLIGIAIALSYSKNIIVLIIIAGFSIFPNNLISAFNSIFNAKEKMHVPCIMSMSFSTIYLILGISCLYAGLGLYSLVTIITFLSLLNALFTGILINPALARKGGAKKLIASFKFSISFAFYKKIIKQSTPFAVLSALSIIYFRVDSVILSKLGTFESVGLYNSAYKIVEFLMFFPVCLMMACFPQMSKQAKDSAVRLRGSYLKALSLLIIIIVPISIFCTIFADNIITFLYGGKFLPAAGALRILVWAVLVMFINAPFGNVLYNSDKLFKYIPFAIFHTLLNIYLNLVFIPKWGFIGASWVTLITEIAGFLIQIWFIKQILFSRPCTKQQSL